MSTPNDPITSARRSSAVRRKNLRLALILASVAVVFFIGFMAKSVLLSSP